jgi:hypothetical protein
VGNDFMMQYPDRMPEEQVCLLYTRVNTGVCKSAFDEFLSTQEPPARIDLGDEIGVLEVTDERAMRVSGRHYSFIGKLLNEEALYGEPEAEGFDIKATFHDWSFLSRILAMAHIRVSPVRGVASITKLRT